MSRALVALSTAASVAAVCGGCAAHASSPVASARPARVTVSMFSVRADPTFLLTPEQSAQLGACVGDSESGGGRAPDGLGFRYFVVEGVVAQTLYVGADGVWRGSAAESATPILTTSDCFGILRGGGGDSPAGGCGGRHTRALTERSARRPAGVPQRRPGGPPKAIRSAPSWDRPLASARRRGGPPGATRTSR